MTKFITPTPLFKNPGPCGSGCPGSVSIGGGGGGYGYGGGGGGGGGAGGGAFGGSVASFATCSPCLNSIFECVVSFLPLPIACAYTCYGAITSIPTASGWGNVYGLSNCALACIEWAGGKALNYIMCAWGIGRDCFGWPLPDAPSRRRRAVASAAVEAAFQCEFAW